MHEEQAGVGSQRFTLSLEHPHLKWSNTMDMICVWSSPDRVVELHRVGYKHQKVFSKEDLVGPTSIAFNEGTPGKNSMFLIAVGYEDGKIVLVNAENAEELFNTKIIDFGAPITAMHWQDASLYDNVQSTTEDFTKHVKSI